MNFYVYKKKFYVDNLDKNVLYFKMFEFFYYRVKQDLFNRWRGNEKFISFNCVFFGGGRQVEVCNKVVELIGEKIIGLDKFVYLKVNY